MKKNIWADQIEATKEDFQGFEIKNAVLKACLKVAVYGALNGGNPLCNNILESNILDEHFSHLDKVEREKLRASFTKVFSDWKILKELKELQMKASFELGDKNAVYSIDRKVAYVGESRHKMISRFLQPLVLPKGKRARNSFIKYYCLFRALYWR